MIAIFVFFLLTQEITGPFSNKWLYGKGDSLIIRPNITFKFGNDLSSFDTTYSKSYFVSYLYRTKNHISRRNYLMNVNFRYNPEPTTEKFYKYTTSARFLARFEPDEGDTMKGAWGRSDPCITGLYTGAYHWGKGYIQTMSSLYLHHYNYSGGTLGFYAGLSLDWHVLNGSRANKMVGLYIRTPEKDASSRIDTLIGLEIKPLEGIASSVTYDIRTYGTSRFGEIQADWVKGFQTIFGKNIGTISGGTYCTESYATYTTDFTVDGTRTIYFVDASANSVNISLHTLLCINKISIIKVKRVGTGYSVTLIPTLGTIDGEPSYRVSGSWDSYILFCDGTDWYILARY